MKFSIITVTYNSERFLRQTIESVLSQDYANFEYIIVDGNSTDGTKGLIEEYGSRISHYISEPDRNMYDAINKGMRIASGDYISILNSDDFFASKSVLSSMAKKIQSHSSEQYLGFYGDLIKVDEVGGFKRYRRGISVGFAGLLASEKLTFIGHGTVFLQQYCLDKVGFYDDEHFSYACDYDYILRCLKIGRLRHVSVPIMCFRAHAESITSSGKIDLEVAEILNKHTTKKRVLLKKILWLKWLCMNWKSMCCLACERLSKGYGK